MEIREIVSDYLVETGLNMGQFAGALSLVGRPAISHVSIGAWKDGKCLPSVDLLCSILLHCRDWRFDFALECLVVRDPEVWGWRKQ